MAVPIGVLLPNGVPGVTAVRVRDWARLADAGPFSSVGVADRLVYCNHDPMLTLAAAAAITTRVRLLTCAALAPLRAAAVFAKEAATLAAMAPGRLTLGVAVGARPEDCAAVGVPWEERGRRLDDALAMLAGLRDPEDPEQSLGPAPGPVEVLVGGASPPALRRLVSYADGYISGGVAPWVFGAEAFAAQSAWRAAGRTGRPRLVAGTWFARSEDQDDLAAARLRSYLLRGGPPPAVLSSISRGKAGIETTVRAFRELGADEVVFFPLLDDVDELEWLADVVVGLPDIARGEPAPPAGPPPGPLGPPPRSAGSGGDGTSTDSAAGQVTAPNGASFLGGVEALTSALGAVDAALPDRSRRARREAVVAEHIRAENEGDVAGVLATFPDGASYTVKPLTHSHDSDESVRELLDDLVTAFPDLTLQPLRVHHTAEAVVVEGRMTGTQRADWSGIPSAGRRMDLEAAVFFRFAGDRLTNETVYYDHLTAVAQLSDPAAAPVPEVSR